jgi:hypothetical protein
MVTRAWPEVTTTGIAEGYAVSTYVARCRDAIKGLLDPAIEYSDGFNDLRIALRETAGQYGYKVSYHKGRLIIGPPGEVDKYKVTRKQLLTLTQGTWSPQVLFAIVTLIDYDWLEDFTVPQEQASSLDEVILPDSVQMFPMPDGSITLTKL